MANVVGTYELVKSDKFDEYMEDVGVGYLTRKAASVLKPTTIIKKEGEQYHIQTISTFKNTDLKFELGKKFEEVTADGRKCESIVVMEGDSRMKHNQLCNKQDLVMYRDFTPEGMTLTLHSPKVVCTRVYKRTPA